MVEFLIHFTIACRYIIYIAYNNNIIWLRQQVCQFTTKLPTSRNILHKFLSAKHFISYSQFLLNVYMYIGIIMWMDGWTVLRIITKKCVHSIYLRSIWNIGTTILKRKRNIQSGMWRFIIHIYTHHYHHRRANYIYYG